MVATKIFRRLALDVVLWLCAPTLFLFAYVFFHGSPLTAALPHYRLVLLALLSLTLGRIILFRLIWNEFGSQLAAAIITAFFLIVLLFYYGLVLIGLGSWGQVISVDLITSYATQLPDLAKTLGIPLFLAISALGLAYAFLFAAVLRYLKKFDWTLDLAPRLPGWRIAAISAFGAVIWAAELFNFLMSPATDRGEPVALTFFPIQATRSISGDVIDKSTIENLDLIEDAERSAYKINPGADRKNLVLIVVDALRPDHLGIYGYARDTTPNLRVLQESGAMRHLSGVRSSCSASACGLLSIASSKFVHQFSNRPFTLQQVLRLHGYRFHMIMGGDHTNFSGLKELYGPADSYFDGSQAHGYFNNDDQLVIDRTKSLAPWDGQPVIIQFHLMSAHLLGKRHDASIRFLPSGSYAPPRYRPAELVERAINFYDNGVIQADSIIQELVTTLQSKGYLQNSLVVITGDHGELLGEHGLFGHASSVREEALRIPLVFLSFGYVPVEFPDNRRPASQVDIAPTILEEFGMTRPATWVGVPLQKTETRDYSYFEQGNHVGLINYRDRLNIWKYWIDKLSKEQHAFNLSIDPGERANAIDSLPQDYLRTLRLQLMRLHPNLHPLLDDPQSGRASP